MANRSKKYQHIFAEVSIKDSILDSNLSNPQPTPFNLAYKIYTEESKLSIYLDKILAKGFSPIQQDTAHLLKQGLTTIEIARLRGVNVSTVTKCINGQGKKGGGLQKRSIALIKENAGTLILYVNRIRNLLPDEYDDLNLPTYRLVCSVLFANEDTQDRIRVRQSGRKSKRNNMSIKLSWTASTTQVSGYNVYRDHNRTPLNGNVPVANTTFTDSTALPGKVYFYEVKAAFNGAESTATSLSTSDTHAKAFALGKIIQDASGHFHEATTAGTTGTTLPKFSTAMGSTTKDGTVVWTVKSSGATPVALLKSGQAPAAPSNLLIVARS
jgi:hypothetical protein